MSTPTVYTQGGALECRACGASYMPGYPLPVGAAIALTRWWRGTHDACQPLGSQPPAWTGNEHMLCASCGRHDHMTMTSVGGRPVCAGCVDRLFDLIAQPAPV